MSQFSLVDILYSPHLDRLAANAPVYRRYSIRDNPRYPRLNAWFAAIRQRAAYHQVRSDDTTNVLLLRRRFGIEPSGAPLALNAEDSAARQFRAEAAERLSDNREMAIADILKNSGVQSFVSANFSVEAAVDFYLRQLADHLLQEHPDLLAGGNTGGKDSTTEPAFAGVGAIALAYLRNRICAPRDMSAGAATALRAACDRLFTSLY